MKTILYSLHQYSDQWGNASGILSYNDGNGGTEAEFRGVLYSGLSIDASGNIIDPNRSNMVLQYNNGITAPVRLVSELGSGSFLDPASIFSGWTMDNVVPVEYLPKISDNGCLFFALNEQVSNDVNGNYFEISITGFTKKLTQNSVNGIQIKIGYWPFVDSSSINFGFLFYDLVNNKFDSATLNNGDIANGIVGYVDRYTDANVQSFDCQLIKNTFDLANSPSNQWTYSNRDNPWRIKSFIPSGSSIGVSNKTYTFEISKSSVFGKISYSGSEIFSSLQSTSVLSNIDENTVILIPSVYPTKAGDTGKTTSRIRLIEVSFLT